MLVCFLLEKGVAVSCPHPENLSADLDLGAGVLSSGRNTVPKIRIQALQSDWPETESTLGA